MSKALHKHNNPLVINRFHNHGDTYQYHYGNVSSEILWHGNHYFRLLPASHKPSPWPHKGNVGLYHDHLLPLEMPESLAGNWERHAWSAPPDAFFYLDQFPVHGDRASAWGTGVLSEFGAPLDLTQEPVKFTSKFLEHVDITSAQELQRKTGSRNHYTWVDQIGNISFLGPSWHERLKTAMAHKRQKVLRFFDVANNGQPASVELTEAAPTEILRTYSFFPVQLKVECVNGYTGKPFYTVITVLATAKPLSSYFKLSKLRSKLRLLTPNHARTAPMATLANVYGVNSTAVPITALEDCAATQYHAGLSSRLTPKELKKINLKYGATFNDKTSSSAILKKIENLCEMEALPEQKDVEKAEKAVARVDKQVTAAKNKVNTHNATRASHEALLGSIESHLNEIADGRDSIKAEMRILLQKSKLLDIQEETYKADQTHVEKEIAKHKAAGEPLAVALEKAQETQATAKAALMKARIILSDAEAKYFEESTDLYDLKEALANSKVEITHLAMKNTKTGAILADDKLGDALTSSDWVLQTVQFRTTEPTEMTIYDGTKTIDTRMCGPIEIKLDSDGGYPYAYARAASAGSVIVHLTPTTTRIHPHVDTAGGVTSGATGNSALKRWRNICMGEASGAAVDAFASKSLESVVHVMLAWLRSVDSRDSWGKCYNLFPKPEDVWGSYEEGLERHAKSQFKGILCSPADENGTRRFHRFVQPAGAKATVIWTTGTLKDLDANTIVVQSTRNKAFTSRSDADLFVTKQKQKLENQGFKPATELATEPVVESETATTIAV